MPRYYKITLFSFAILLTLACQTITQGLGSPLTATPDSPQAIKTDIQLAVFEELWGIVDQEYLYEDFNGQDWNATYELYHTRIEGGVSNEAFYLAMDEMIRSLGDEHSVFLDPQEVAEEDAEFAGNLSYVGIGVLISPVPERDRAVILLSFPGSPADTAGLQSHDSILSVDGDPILDGNGEVRDILRGDAGTKITLEVLSPGGVPRAVEVSRQKISGAVPVPYQVIPTPAGKRLGYILLVTFSDGTIADQVGAAIQDMSQEGNLDGLIIDNRLNEGGYDSMLAGTLAYFVDGTIGSFLSRGEQRPFIVRAEDVNGSQDFPLVVLIGSDTVSFGEIFAGVLKDLGQAYLIGETTDGNVETLWGYDFVDGSRAWIAHDSFQPLNHPDQDWEQTGIIPDQIVAADWDQITFETDPAIAAAVDYLEAGSE